MQETTKEDFLEYMEDDDEEDNEYECEYEDSENEIEDEESVKTGKISCWNT